MNAIHLAVCFSHFILSVDVKYLRSDADLVNTSHYIRNLFNLATFLASVSLDETPSGDHKPLILTTNRKDAMQRVDDTCSSSMVT